MGSGSLLILLEPALLSGSSLTSGGLALNFNLLGLIGLQFIGQVGLLGGLGGSGNAELLDVSFGITGFDGRRLESTEFTEVEVLNGIGCYKVRFWLVGDGDTSSPVVSPDRTSQSKKRGSHTLTNSGGQESAARSRRNLLPRDAGEERALWKGQQPPLRRKVSNPKRNQYRLTDALRDWDIIAAGRW